MVFGDEPSGGRGTFSAVGRGAFGGRPVVARFRRDAFSGCRQWQDLAAMRSRAAIRGSFFASCVPEGASDGKSAPSWQNIAAVHPKRAGFGKICAPCIRKAPQTGGRGCTARRSCQEGAPFAARAPQIMHGAKILPRPDGAEQRRGVRRTRAAAPQRHPWLQRAAAVPVAPAAPAPQHSRHQRPRSSHGTGAISATAAPPMRTTS